MGRLIKKAGKQVELMHGTSSSVLESALQNGLLPQGLTDTTMFHYNDYGRNGESKHPQCVYLTDDLDNAMKYAQNAVKHLNGFPIVLKVEVDSDALTWDDDAFYKNYGDFDFGERNESTGIWIKRPDEEFWQQSLKINNQCAHYGEVPSTAFKEFYLNGKWFSVEDFLKVYQAYTSMNAKGALIEEDKKAKYKKMEFSIVDKLSLDIVVLKRNIFLYNLQLAADFDNDSKIAFTVRVLDFIKNNISEWGAAIIYSPDLKRLNFNPKISCFNYVFGVFKIKSEQDIIEEIQEDTDRSVADDGILEQIIECTATQDQFDELYDYSIDFVGDLVDYCQNVLNHDTYSTIEILTNIEDHYVDAYDQLSSEIQYLKHKVGFKTKI